MPNNIFKTLRLNFNMAQFTPDQFEKVALKGYGLRVIQGVPYTHIIFDHVDERFVNESSISARRGNTWFSKFDECFIKTAMTVPKGTLIIEVITEPDGIMVDDGGKYYYPNWNDVIDIDLSVARLVPTEILGTGGLFAQCVCLTIARLSGTMSLNFEVDISAQMSFDSLAYPAMITIDQDITRIFCSNAAQVGKSATLYLGKRE